MSVTPQELLEANGIKLDDYAPGQHSTTCPNCSPKRVKNTLKCLSVLICDDGKTVCWHCHHCGWSGGSGGGPPSNKKTYDYLDADGRLLFQKVRNPPGSKDRFYCRRPDGKGGWISNLKGIKIKPLYRWHEVKKAKEEGREIALVEGEKDADNLWALGIAATCNFDGAADVIKDPKAKSKWKAEYSEQLRGAHLVVFNDNDSPGYAHADHICRASINVAARVRRLDLALHWLDMPKGDDVSDYLVGHTREELVALIAAAPDYAAPEQPTEPKPNDFDAEIARLAKLSMLEYEQQRKAATDKLDVRASILDKLVQAERVRLGLDGGDDGKQGHAIEFTEIEPWPEPVNGAELLDEIATAVRSYVVMVNHFRDTCALWSMHTYLIDRFFISPRLGIHSPVKRCGKTTLLDVLSRLVARPLPASNVSSASVFRVVEAHRPTLLIDEADTFLPDNDELRGVINTGHRKGGVVLRTVGDDHEVRAFATYSACAIALIGKLPDTIHDRAVSGELKRKLPSETKTIKSFRPDRADHLDVLARKQARWAKDHADSIAARDPEMPPGIINRAADNWRPLLAIADEAGGEWPERVRAAVLAAHDAGEAGEQASWIELVLGDIRDTFAQLGGAPVAELFATSADLEIPSKALVETLIAIEGRPWAEMGKSRKPMSQNRLARILNPLDIRPGKIGPEDARLNGYKLGQFKDAFERYLPPEGASQPDIQTERDEIRTSDILQPDSHETGCPVEKCEKPNNDGLLSTCPVAKGGAGEKAQRTARPKSDDLPYTGEVVPVPDMGPDSLDPHGVPVAGNGGTEPGLSRRRLQELADWYQDQGHQRHNTGTLDTAALDDELRAILRDEVATPEHVEIEFERVMQIVFRI